MGIVVDHLKAGFPALWIQTMEPARAMAEYSQEAKKVGYKAFSWDCMAGIKEIGNGFHKEDNDPVSALGFLKSQQSKSILFLFNFHRFTRPASEGATEVIQEIMNLAEPYKAQGKLEPRRLWKRYLVNNCEFIWLAGLEIVARRLGRTRPSEP